MAEFIGLRIDEEAKAKLARMAKRQGISVNSLLKELIEQRAISSSGNADLVRLDAFRKALNQANASALELVDRLKALQQLKADIESEVEKLRQRYEDQRSPAEWLFGDGAASKAVRSRVGQLEAQLATCDEYIHEIRVHLFGGVKPEEARAADLPSPAEAPQAAGQER